MIYDLCDFCRLVMLARWFTKQYRERPDLVKVGGGVFTHKTHQTGGTGQDLKKYTTKIAILRKCWKNQIKTSNSSGSSSNKHCSNFHLHIRLLLCRRGTSQTSQKHAHVRRSNDVGHQFFNVIG